MQIMKIKMVYNGVIKLYKLIDIKYLHFTWKVEKSSPGYKFKFPFKNLDCGIARLSVVFLLSFSRW